MENLEKLIYDLYKKNARQCTNEEIYNALLIYTKNQLFEKGYQNGKKKNAQDGKACFPFYSFTPGGFHFF